MREKCDLLEEKVRKLKKAVKIYANRLKESGSGMPSTSGEGLCYLATLKIFTLVPIAYSTLAHLYSQVRLYDLCTSVSFGYYWGFLVNSVNSPS